MASGALAGEVPAASTPLLPAATTTTTPAAVARAMAWPSGPPAAPAPPRLAFTTSMPPLRTTQSSPAMNHDMLPLPASPMTLTPQTRAPGAVPTTPVPLSLAATVPATCVPCPLLSVKAVAVQPASLAQFTPPAIVRSGWALTPESRMATSTSTAVPVPMRLPGTVSARTRCTPTGTSPDARIGTSA